MAKFDSIVYHVPFALMTIDRGVDWLAWKPFVFTLNRDLIVSTYHHSYVHILRLPLLLPPQRRANHIVISYISFGKDVFSIPCNIISRSLPPLISTPPPIVAYAPIGSHLN